MRDSSTRLAAGWGVPPLLWTALVGGVLLVGSGCNRSPAPVEAPTPEQASATLDSAFADASAENRAAAQKSAEALKQNNSAGAFFNLEALSSRPDLSAEQREAAAKAMLAAHLKLQQAAAAGDATAREALEQRAATK